MALLGLGCRLGFSLVAASGGCSLARCTGFSLRWLLLWSTGCRCVGFSSCSTRAQNLQPLGLECRLGSCGTWAQLLRHTWDLPRPGIKLVSPTLAGRFFTTEPPGKPLLCWFLIALGVGCTRAFSSCSEQVLLASCGVWVSHCGGFSCGGVPALGMQASVVVGALLPRCMWDLPRPGAECESSAVAGGFLTPGPAAKSWPLYLSVFCDHKTSTYQVLTLAHAGWEPNHIKESSHS